jgi:hypothetical protein
LSATKQYTSLRPAGSTLTQSTGLAATGTESGPIAEDFCGLVKASAFNAILVHFDLKYVPDVFIKVFAMPLFSFVTAVPLIGPGMH